MSFLFIHWPLPDVSMNRLGMISLLFLLFLMFARNRSLIMEKKKKKKCSSEEWKKSTAAATAAAETSMAATLTATKKVDPQLTVFSCTQSSFHQTVVNPSLACKIGVCSVTADVSLFGAWSICALSLRLHNGGIHSRWYGLSLCGENHVTVRLSGLFHCTQQLQQLQRVTAFGSVYSFIQVLPLQQNFILSH